MQGIKVLIGIVCIKGKPTVLISVKNTAVKHSTTSGVVNYAYGTVVCIGPPYSVTGLDSQRIWEKAWVAAGIAVVKCQYVRICKHGDVNPSRAVLV